MAISSKYPTLQLSTVKRAGLPVEISGKMYETVAPTEWGMDKAYESRQFFSQINAFESKIEDPKKTVTPEEVKQYSYNLHEFCKIILPTAPVAKIDALGDVEANRLVKYFFSVLRKVREIPLLDENGTKPTSSTLLPDSAESTPE